MTRSDPIGDKYYRPLAYAESISSIFFVVAAGLSIASLFAEEWPWKAIIQISFVIVVVSAFVLGSVINLYLAPRAEEQRRLDLLSNSYSVKLTHQNATGYFNNSEINPIRRLALSVMESSFFTNNISGIMLFRERFKVILYFAVWFVCVLLREAELSLVLAATQVLFSEQILSRWMRMEYLRYRSGAVFQSLQRLLTTVGSFDNSSSHAQILDGFSNYEAAKSRASVVLSEKVFNSNNARLSAEWDDIRASLNLK